jgi:hypothetical protein
MSDLAVQDIDPQALYEAPHNPRTIDPARFEQLKRSLEADPEMLRARPVIALPSGEVVAGNMRLRAVRELGWATVPTVYAELDDRRAREWMLRDNNEFGSWADDDLGALLASLGDAGADLSLLGFEDGELERLLGAVGGDDETLGDGSASEDRPSLSDRFLVPPFSVLDARQGYWQERKRYWLAMGIQSELGRGDATRDGSHGDRRPGAEGEGKYSGGDAYRYVGRKDTGLLGESEQAEDYRKSRGDYSKLSPGGSPRDATTLGKNGRTVRGDGKGRAIDAKD